MINHVRGDYSDDGWFGAVFVDGQMLAPRQSQRVVNHSPDGFAWGYGGSGPAQLALAILLAVGVPKNVSIALHQAFKWAFLANAPRGPLAFDVDVRAWVDDKRGKAQVRA